MEIRTLYPYYYDLSNRKYWVITLTKIIASAQCANRIRPLKARIILTYSKKATKNNHVYQRHYWTDEELIGIYKEVLQRIFLCSTQIVKWDVREGYPQYIPQVHLRVIELRKSE
jgi:hypothetical protein